MIVEEVMTTFPKTLDAHASVRQAARLMRDEDIGVVPIIDDLGVLVGVVTDRDIVVRAVAEGRDGDASIEECITRKPDTVPKDLPVETAMQLMSERQIRRLPVVEFGRLIGIVSLGDLAVSAAPEREKGETLEQISLGPEDHREDLPADLA